MAEQSTAKARRQYRIDHGLCPLCGEEAAPYYLCYKHRQHQVIRRFMNNATKWGVVSKVKEGNSNKYYILPDWEQQFDVNYKHPSWLDLRPDDKRRSPRLGRMPVKLDETLAGIFREANRPLMMEEIYEAWGRLRSRRKTESLAGDMTAIIAAQRRRDERNAKRAQKGAQHA